MSAPRLAPARDGVHAQTVVRCRACDHPLTVEDARICVDGQHVLVRENPDHVQHTVAFYKDAPGTIVEDEPEPEHSFVDGAAWQYLTCARCHHQVGWSFLFLRDQELEGAVVRRVAALLLDGVVRE